MSDIVLTVSGMTRSPDRYDVTITVECDGGRFPNPAEFAAAAGQAALARGASIMKVHTAGQIISVVTVKAADRPAVVAVALAVVSEALWRPGASPHQVQALALRRRRKALAGQHDPTRRARPGVGSVPGPG